MGGRHGFQDFIVHLVIHQCCLPFLRSSSGRSRAHSYNRLREIPPYLNASGIRPKRGRDR